MVSSGAVFRTKVSTAALSEPVAILAGFEILESLARLMFDLKARKLSIPPDRVAWRMLSAVLELCDGAVARHLDREGAPRSVEFEAFDALLDKEFARHRELSWYARELGYSALPVFKSDRRPYGPPQTPPRSNT